MPCSLFRWKYDEHAENRRPGLNGDDSSEGSRHSHTVDVTAQHVRDLAPWSEAAHAKQNSKCVRAIDGSRIQSQTNRQIVLDLYSFGCVDRWRARFRGSEYCSNRNRELFGASIPIPTRRHIVSSGHRTFWCQSSTVDEAGRHNIRQATLQSDTDKRLCPTACHNTETTCVCASLDSVESLPHSAETARGTEASRFLMSRIETGWT